jgi:hypothetical protein
MLNNTYISILNLLNMSNKLTIDSSKQNYVTLEDNCDSVELSKIKFISDSQNKLNNTNLCNERFMTQEFNIIINADYNTPVIFPITDFVFASIIGKCKIKLSVEHNTLSLKPKNIVLDTCQTHNSAKNILIYTNGIQYHNIVTFKQVYSQIKTYKFITTPIEHMGEIIWNPRFIVSVVPKNNVITNISYRVNWDYNIEEKNQPYLTKEFGNCVICIIPIQYHTGRTSEYINFDSIAELKYAIKTSNILEPVKYFGGLTTNMTKPDIILGEPQNFTCIVCAKSDMHGAHINMEGNVILDD